MDSLQHLVQSLENFLWVYVGVVLILVAGIFLSVQSRFAQIVTLHRCFLNFFSALRARHSTAQRGASPLAVFFASLGGCIGIGNIVAVAVAVQLGGPGALVWVWLTAFLGMIIKYAEVYLGIRFRFENSSGSYDGGPMYFLRYAFPKMPYLASVMALFMCFYGAEIYLFSVIKESMTINFELPELPVIAILLGLILFTVMGGVKRVGTVNSWLIPIFIVVFLIMVTYVLILNYSKIPQVFYQVIISALSGHAAVGGFVGSTVLMTVSKGFASACYSGDVGIGYASIIFAETNVDQPQKQASLAMVGIFIDTIIVCSAVIFLVLITGVWTNPARGGVFLVQHALEMYFPYMNIFMPIFIFMLGFSTITAYMVAGIKSAQFLSPRFGKKIFVTLASSAFIFFSFFDSSLALSIMYSCGGILMAINIPGILRLNKYIRYDF